MTKALQQKPQELKVKLHKLLLQQNNLQEDPNTVIRKVTIPIKPATNKKTSLTKTTYCV